ncbi:MAG: hypothetical protein P1U56_23620 [Saprospiraceae bacterium]|nr:hypothetical protein [Saprospiraceae bacterium]
MKRKITLRKLQNMDNAELYKTYIQAETPKIKDMNGPVKGTVLTPGHSSKRKILNHFFPNNIFPWQGKTFIPLNDVEGIGDNQLKKPNEEVHNDYNFKFTLGDAIDGENAVIVLDYNNISNASNIRFIRDDVKKINDSLFLGRMYSTTLTKYKPMLYFALQKKYK